MVPEPFVILVRLAAHTCIDGATSGVNLPLNVTRGIPPWLDLFRNTGHAPAIWNPNLYRNRISFPVEPSYQWDCSRSRRNTRKRQINEENGADPTSQISTIQPSIAHRRRSTGSLTSICGLPCHGIPWSCLVQKDDSKPIAIVPRRHFIQTNAHRLLLCFKMYVEQDGLTIVEAPLSFPLGDSFHPRGDRHSPRLDKFLRQTSRRDHKPPKPGQSHLNLTESSGSF